MNKRTSVCLTLSAALAIAQPALRFVHLQK